MPLTVPEAKRLGADKLQIDSGIFDVSLEAARRLHGMRDQDLGVMTLALAVLGVSKATASDRGLQAELTDALALVAKAEAAWRTELRLRN